LKEGTVPKGLRINLKINAVNQNDLLSKNVQKIIGRSQISIMEELRCHYVRTCTELEKQIEDTRQFLSSAKDSAAQITKAYEETQAKVGLLNNKLDQRRGKKMQTNLLNQNLPDRRPRRRTNQARAQGDKPQQFNQRIPNQEPPNSKQPTPNRQYNNYHFRNVHNPAEQLRPPPPPLSRPDSALTPGLHPNQYWGNTNPLGNQLGGLVNTLNQLLQTLQPPPTYQSYPQPNLLYQR